MVQPGARQLTAAGSRVAVLRLLLVAGRRSCSRCSLVAAARHPAADTGASAGDGPVQLPAGWSGGTVAVEAFAARRRSTPCAHRGRRPVPVRPGWRRVPEPRGHPAGPAAWLLPRVHRRDARFTRPGRPPDRDRGGRRALLHRRPLRLVPVHRRRCRDADDAHAPRPGCPRAADPVLDRGGRGAPRPGGLGVRVVDVARGARQGGLLDAFAGGPAFPAWVGRNWDALDRRAARPVVVGGRATGRAIIVAGPAAWTTRSTASGRRCATCSTSAADRWRDTPTPLGVLVRGRALG